MNTRGDGSMKMLVVGILCGLVAACGRTSSPQHDAAGGHDGGDAAGDSEAVGLDATADVGSAGAGDATDATDATADATDAPPSDGGADLDAAAGDATDGATSDASAADAPAEIDAGAGCLSPGAEATLSATAQGLPADGLVLWVRGDRGVYKTAANAVCGWRDQISPTRLLLPSSSRPTWQSASVGGQAAIHFNVVGSDLYTDLLGISATSARTFIAVSQLVSATGRFHPILQGQGGSAATYLGIDANTWQTAGNREGVYAPLNSYDTATATTTSARVHVMTMSTLTPGTAGTAAVDYRVDGATQTLTLKAGPGTIGDFSAANFTTIGAVSGTPSAGVTAGDAFVAEALIYNRALPLVERAAVETVLKTRYGIQ
jgi:hypothetical protein